MEQKKIQPTVRSSWTETAAQVHLPSVSAPLLEETLNCQGVRSDPTTLCSHQEAEGRVEKCREKTERVRERESKRERERGKRRLGWGAKAPRREFDLICEAFPLWKQPLMPGGF